MGGALTLFLTPMPGNILLSEVMKRVCHRGKVLYEPPIEVVKAYECSFFFKHCWCRPIFYCSNLARVHLHFSRTNNLLCSSKLTSERLAIKL